MGVKFKDYYEVLGVSRQANDDEIKRAFRKLARQYHPDVAKDKKSAEERFKEVNEAYEVLSDPAKRKKYDELGANWKQGANFQASDWEELFGRRGGGEGRHQGGGFEYRFGGTGFSEFFEQLFGSASRSGTRFGTSSPFGAGEETERGADIEGDIMVTLDEALHGSVRNISVRGNAACERCRGSGVFRRQACSACGGSGQVLETEVHKVKIPAGVIEGQRLRIPGRGSAGAGGAGDLYLRVRLARHPDFQVENENLFHELDLAPWEAVLGASVSVPTLDGQVSIRIPPGTQSGQRFRVRGRGLGREGERGDLVVNVRIQVPREAGESGRRLWEQLARESRFNPRD